MPQETKEALRRFEQKMREQGADGFADGPRPWEHWDESGHQANNRIWEGSARRIYPGGRRARSLGHRLLSVLALIALTTLLVGIGGVYFSHTQTRQLAETGVQPLPFTDQQPPAAMAPVSKMSSAAATTRTPVLEALPAPAAGAAAAPEQSAAPDSTSDAPPPATGSSIDSVAIETIVTEQSVTTTVYTRHPRQDEAEVVAAIETTPPPFTHRMDDAHQEVPDTAPATLAVAETGISSEVATKAPDEELQLHPIEETPAAALEVQPVEMPELDPATEQAEALDTIAATDTNSETATTESPAEVETDIETDLSEAQNALLPENPPAEPAEVASIAVAATDTGNTITVEESPAEGAAETIAEPEIESVEPVIAVAKTGGWVINLASYTRESTANRKLALFQQQGIDAEVFAVTINDKPMFRIRVAGYESSRSAKADIPVMEQKLNLEGAWISRR